MPWQRVVVWGWDRVWCVSVCDSGGCCARVLGECERSNVLCRLCVQQVLGSSHLQEVQRVHLAYRQQVRQGTCAFDTIMGSSGSACGTATATTTLWLWCGEHDARVDEWVFMVALVAFCALPCGHMLSPPVERTGVMCGLQSSYMIEEEGGGGQEGRGAWGWLWAWQA